ncbi:hypothetical protein DSCA_21950 [Desulfosarcina alkanivorans]|uniref:Uncharacterized protein n=1 Tax=Desulfosarcina alkanivorans TaxID=571177 RepID=A0A5K7YIQ1_9BACT|nr:DUF166 family protein [Desulfosarcina alkanivorans]BBO68265.1 hypothetical protein DSCA_21950 [Desulfosarcina alkanivorans]
MTSRCAGDPEFEVTVKEGKVSDVAVPRAPPCRATREAARRVKGYSIKEAPVRIGLDTRFFCTADASNGVLIRGESRSTWEAVCMTRRWRRP